MAKTLSNERIQKLRWPTLFMQVIVCAALTAPYLLTVYAGPLNAAHGWSIPGIMIVFTISMWIATPGQLLGAWCIKKFGNKKTIAGAGVLYGLGIIGSGYTSSLIVFLICQGGVAATMLFTAYVAQEKNVGVLFPDKRGLAFGILMGGTWGGTALMAPFAAWLIENTGTATSLLIQGIIYGGVTLLFGILIVDAPEGSFVPKGWTPPTDDSIDDSKRLPVSRGGATGAEVKWNILFTKHPGVFLFMILTPLSSMAIFYFSSNCSLIAQENLGVSAMTAAGIVSIYTAAQGVGAVAMGFLCDKVGVYPMMFVITGLSAIMLLLMGITGATSFALFVVTVIFIGFQMGLNSTVLPLIAMNTWGEKHFPVNITLVGLCNMIATSVGPQIAANVALVPSMLLLGVMMAISAVLVLPFSRSVVTFSERVKAGEIPQDL